MSGKKLFRRGWIPASLLATAALGLWLGGRGSSVESDPTVRRPLAAEPPALPAGRLPDALVPLDVQAAPGRRLPLDLPLPSAARVTMSRRQETAPLGEQSAVVEWPGVQSLEAAGYFEDHLKRAGFRSEPESRRSGAVARHYVRGDQTFSLTARPTEKGVRLTLIFRYTVTGSEARVSIEDFNL